MINWIVCHLRRTHEDPTQIQATINAKAATQEMKRTTNRIDTTIAELQRQESIRQSRHSSDPVTARVRGEVRNGGGR